MLNSAILHNQTDYKCPAMFDCPYTGKTVLEKRELPLCPVTLSYQTELQYKDDLDLAMALSLSLQTYNDEENENILDLAMMM